jgi:ABC-type branched-subunit amino acid transport system substrate-binding protein
VNKYSHSIVAGLAAVALLGAGGGCGDAPPAVPDPDEIPIGLLLSFSGYNAASSVNSERALIMAVEAANALGGIEGRKLRVMAKDTRSRPGATVAEPASELFRAGAAILIGPDTIDLVTQIRPFLMEEQRTILLPSFGTASDVGFGYKPPDWFVMGPGTGRIACELVQQLTADGMSSALVVANAKGYNSAIAWNLGNHYGMRKFILPAAGVSSIATVKSIVGMSATAYILAAFPADASSLIYAMAATGSLGDPSHWYLSPTLHNPAFLATIPKGVLAGARGVAPGTVAGAPAFRAAFIARWHDTPLDDAYPFYDAGMVTALAIEHAVLRTGSVPTGTGLTEDVRGVTRAGAAVVVQWNELEKGLKALRDGQDINYYGLSGKLEFDISGQTSSSATKWWSITGDGFSDLVRDSDCK